MIKCNNCGKVIDKVWLSVFLRDGTDVDIDYPLIECEDNAVYVDTEKNWTGYELTEAEQKEEITCPYCGKFPFKISEIQIHEIVRVVCFKE